MDEPKLGVEPRLGTLEWWQARWAWQKEQVLAFKAERAREEEEDLRLREPHEVVVVVKDLEEVRCKIAAFQELFAKQGSGRVYAYLAGRLEWRQNIGPHIIDPLTWSRLHPYQPRWHRLARWQWCKWWFPAGNRDFYGPDDWEYGIRPFGAFSRERTEQHKDFWFSGDDVSDEEYRTWLRLSTIPRSREEFSPELQLAELRWRARYLPAEIEKARLRRGFQDKPLTHIVQAYEETLALVLEQIAALGGAGS